MLEFNPMSLGESSVLGMPSSAADREIIFHIERWLIERYLPPAGQVIYVGGGPGRYAVEIAKMGRDVVLVDLGGDHIAQARELAMREGVWHRFQSCSLEDGDFSGFESNSFDMAVCFGMLNYAMDRDIQVLGEIERLLKPGSYSLVSVDGLLGAIHHARLAGALSDKGYLSQEDRILTTGLLGGGKPSQKFYTAAQLRTLLERCTLEVVEMAAAPAIAGSLGKPMDDLRRDPLAWDYLLAAEKRYCMTPGLLDAGQHIVAVGRKTSGGCQKGHYH